MNTKNIFRKLIFVLAVSAFCSVSLSAQIRITGVVTNDAANPKPGVNVGIKGINSGVVTDRNGRYSINISNGDAVLIFSFAGFITREITVGKQRIIDVVIYNDARQKAEVNGAGYDTQNLPKFYLDIPDKTSTFAASKNKVSIDA